MNNFLDDLRNLKPALPLLRLSWASIEVQDNEYVVLEACPLTQLCLEKGLITPLQLSTVSWGVVADLIYHTIFQQYGEEAVKAADKFVGEWDKTPHYLVIPEHIAQVVDLVENFQ